jgi:hypothetical protein
MRSAVFCYCSVALLAACSRPDKHADPTPGSGSDISAGPEAAGSPAVSLEDFAGKWQTRATDERGTNMGEAELLATGDTSGWTLTFPKQKPIPLRVVAVGGDSVVTEAEYPSSRVKGARVRTRAVNRLENGKLVATLEARYTVAGRDSVLHLKVEGTRKP